eukprot:1902573-Rhodomonas_salina.1
MVVMCDTEIEDGDSVWAQLAARIDSHVHRHVTLFSQTHRHRHRHRHTDTQTRDHVSPKQRQRDSDRDRGEATGRDTRRSRQSTQHIDRRSDSCRHTDTDTDTDTQTQTLRHRHRHRHRHSSIWRSSDGFGCVTATERKSYQANLAAGSVTHSSEPGQSLSLIHI